MARIRRIAAIAVLSVVAVAYGAATPAHADTPEVFQGTAKAVGLDLNILGTAATLGQATATVQSAVEAVGTGVGQLLALTPGHLPVLTRATPAKPAPSPGLEGVAVPGLGAPLDSILQLQRACGSSTTSFDGGRP